MRALLECVWPAALQTTRLSTRDSRLMKSVIRSSECRTRSSECKVPKRVNLYSREFGPMPSLCSLACCLCATAPTERLIDCSSPKPSEHANQKHP
jgi:hypothetical protein